VKIGLRTRANTPLVTRPVRSVGSTQYATTHLRCGRRHDHGDRHREADSLGRRAVEWRYRVETCEPGDRCSTPSVQRHDEAELRPDAVAHD